MKVVLVITSLESGGAERVACLITNYWADQGWSVTILTLTDSQLSFYELDSRIKLKPLGVYAVSTNLVLALWNNARRLAKLRSAIYQEDPDVVISFMDRTNVITTLAVQGLGIPLLVSERCSPIANSTGYIWQQLRRWLYPQADRVIVQTAQTRKYFEKWLSPARLTVIPNPISLPCMALESAWQPPKKPSLISMGRLVPQKGFDRLLPVVAQLSDRYPDWTLTILGEGPMRTELEELRDRLGLRDRVFFPGRVTHPHAYLQQADLFVFPSRFEGFPMALCEAMACGLPVIATDCPDGPSEIVRHEIDGLLVPNDDGDALYATLDRLMGSPQERVQFGQRAIEVTTRFSQEKIMRLWEEQISQVVLSRQQANTATNRFEPLR